MINISNIKITGRLNGTTLGPAERYWFATYSTANSDIFQSIVYSELDNAIYVCGSESSVAVIVRYDLEGNIIWKKKLATCASFYSIDIDDTGFIYVVGTSVSKMHIMKLNSNGTVVWKKTWNTIYSPADGRLSVSGNSIYINSTIIASANNLALIKLDSNGSMLWQKKLSHGSVSLNSFRSDTDSEGNLYISGTASSDCTIYKVSSTGALTTSKNFTIAGVDALQDIIVDGEYVYAVGYLSTSSIFVVKLTKDLSTVVWQKKIDGPTNDLGYSITSDIENIYITGSSNLDITIVSLSKDGTVINWQNYIGTTSNNDRGLSLVCTDQHLYLAGYANNDATLFNVPKDGSLTGTYGIYNYNIQSLSMSTPSLTLSTPTYGIANYTDTTFTDEIGSLVDATGTNTVIYMN